MGAIATTLFLGGWQVPGVGPEVYAAARASGALPALGWWGLQLLSMLVMVVKTLVVLNVIVWIRWTLPRIRIDQMMNLCWKYLVPVAFVASSSRCSGRCWWRACPPSPPSAAG